MRRNPVWYIGVKALGPKWRLNISIPVQLGVYRHRLRLRPGNLNLLCYPYLHWALGQFAIEMRGGKGIQRGLGTRIRVGRASPG